MPWMKGQVDLKCQTACVVLQVLGFLGIQGDVVAS